MTDSDYSVMDRVEILQCSDLRPMPKKIQNN
jgi:hypothetical protein